MLNYINIFVHFSKGNTMPQPYTYQCAAKGAWKNIFDNDAVSPAFRIGALGVQPLRCYNLFHKARTDALCAEADKIETQNSGDFLEAMVFEAQTDTEQQYALGFLAHYAADCSLRPYEAGVSSSSAKYAGEQGRAKLEAAMDTYFHAQETGVAYVPLNDAFPDMTAEQQTSVCALLRRTAAAAYKDELSLEQLCDAFYEYKTLCRLSCSPNNKNAVKIFFCDVFFIKQKNYIKSRVTPCAPPKGGFAHEWQNPYTRASFSDNGPDAILRQAVRVATGYMHAAQQYWAGRITLENFRLIIGSNVYETGMPCE